MINVTIPATNAVNISFPKPFPLANLTKNPFVSIGPNIQTTARLIKNKSQSKEVLVNKDMK